MMDSTPVKTLFRMIMCVFLSNFLCIELFIMSMYASYMPSIANYYIEDSFLAFRCK